MKLVWSPRYQVNLFGHVFPVEKYRLVREWLLSQGIFTRDDFVEAEPASESDLLLVYTKAYIDDLLNLRLTHRTIRSELPLTREIVNAYIIAAGGTLKAAALALEDAICVHIGGGYHHAYPDHAEGFCYINDVAVAIESLRKRGSIKRSIIIDCDLHQGNGTAFIFSQQPDVFTFSIHQENNYPPKEKSDLDIGLPDGAGDGLYLSKLSVIRDILSSHNFDLAFYLAGADPFERDLLGGLSVSLEGLQRRDELVFSECQAHNLPVCVVLAGGYAEDIMDVVRIHVNTIMTARKYSKTASR